MNEHNRVPSFAGNIQRLRVERGWSQRELAARLGCHQVSVSTWEQGIKVPRLPKLLAMAELFECSIDSLLGANSASIQVQ
jgi:transcriptional regulator with XRE-family HTH domain